VTGLTTTQTALQAIDSVLGTPGSGSDIGSLLGNLQNSFSTLLTDPSSQTQQSAVVSSATTLAQGINSLSAAYTTQTQGAQNDLVSAVSTLNTTLATIGQLSDQIIALQPTGQSVADLENQRNAAVATLSELMSVQTTVQPNGGLSVFTSTGLTLPTNGGTTGPFAIAGGNAQPGAAMPGITLNGTTDDVTSQIQGGRIGADLTLRDTTLPTAQAELDEFSQGLSSRFAAQGLNLFTGVPSATVGGTPVQTGYVGCAATIQVNPAVTTDPSLVRDGTGAGSNSGNLAGYTGLISQVLNYTFGSQSASGVPQPTMNTTGLGANGTLTAPFGSPSTLSDYATDLVASQAQTSATVTGQLTTEQALQTSLTAKISSVSGVNMDTEMSQMIGLQNAYGANARVIAAVQAMFTQLLQAVQ
jgi:flagellar hook-associated protein 1 FlgK